MAFGQIFLFIVAAVIQRLIAPKAPKPPALEVTDFDVPTADEGRPIPVVFGTVTVRGPNVVWYGDLGTDPIKTSSSKKPG